MKRFFDAVKRWLSCFASSTADFIQHWVLIPFLLAMAAGVGVWSLTHLRLLDALALNRVPNTDRLIALGYLVVALVLIAAFLTTFAIWYRRRKSSWPKYEVISPIYRLFCFLFILPGIAVLSTRRIELKETIFVIILISGIAVACFPTFAEIIKWISSVKEKWLPPQDIDGGRPSIRRRLLSYLPAFVVFVMFVVYCFHFSAITINGLQALKTKTTDMTIYTNILYHSAHGDPLGCALVRSGNHAAAHFDPILILFSPFFMLYPRPEFLAVLQTIWFGLGLFPAFWLGRRILKTPWGGVAVAALYGLHPTLHQVNLFEFHSLALLGSPVLLAIYLIEARYYKRLFAVLPIILLIREDAALLMCFVGIAAILTNRKDAWVGSLIILISISYFIVIKILFMKSPDMIMSGKDTYNYRKYFDYMIPRGGVSNLVVTMLTNPVYTLRQTISMAKFAFILRLMGPLLFVPVLAKKRRVMLLYSVIFLLLASKPAVFGARFHYQIIAFPILIGLVPFGIGQLMDRGWLALKPRQLMAALLATLLVSTAAHGVMFGAVTKTKTRNIYSYRLKPSEKKRFDKVLEFSKMMEPEASVMASYDLAPYSASRMLVYSMNHYRPKEPTDYLFLYKAKMRREYIQRFEGQIKDGIYKEVASYQKVFLYKLDKKLYKKLNKKKNLSDDKRKTRRSKYHPLNKLKGK
jgi:uncharacterized membrane protein